MKDEIKDINISKPIINIIINIQNSDEPGAHWSAFHKGAAFNIDDKTFIHFGMIVIVGRLMQKLSKNLGKEVL